ncbi:MAG: hypothetical protein ACI87N_003336 [Flavobacteriales bacterium]|jgi:hypothetical protein
MIKKNTFIFVFFLNFLSQINAQGELMVYPKRITFDGIKNRVQVVNLGNTSKDTVTYRLSHKEIKMDKYGKFSTIEQPEDNQFFASPYLRYYPRTITLAPSEWQRVKIQLIKSSELKEGEYRSHLYFQPIAKSKLLQNHTTTMKTLKTKEKSVVAIKALIGISIANIITVGPSNTAVTLSNLTLLPPNVLALDINRSGNQSVYGELNVNHISLEGIRTNIAEIRGYAVYTPGNLRKTKIKLKTDVSVDYTNGKLQVTYTTPNQVDTYDEAFLNLSASEEYSLETIAIDTE